MASDIIALYDKAAAGPLSRQDLQWLDNLVREYPYFSLAYTVLAKHHKEARSTVQERFLLKAAGYANNRQVLKDYILGHASTPLATVTEKEPPVTVKKEEPAVETPGEVDSTPKENVSAKDGQEEVSGEEAREVEAVTESGSEPVANPVAEASPTEDAKESIAKLPPDPHQKVGTVNWFLNTKIALRIDKFSGMSEDLAGEMGQKAEADVPKALVPEDEKEETPSVDTLEVADSKEPANQPEPLEAKQEETQSQTPAEPESVVEAKEEAHISEEETPVSKEEAPISEEETPVSKEEAPISEEETPVSKEEVPISEEETPVSKEEAPISEEETPVSKEEVPISDEETKENTELSVGAPVAMQDESPATPFTEAETPSVGSEEGYEIGSFSSFSFLEESAPEEIQVESSPESEEKRPTAEESQGGEIVFEEKDRIVEISVSPEQLEKYFKGRLPVDLNSNKEESAPKVSIETEEQQPLISAEQEPLAIEKASPKVERQKSRDELEVILNTFIENEPSIRPPSADSPLEDLSGGSANEESDWVTETLARIYADQGNYKKATKIYQKLGLLFPEKKAYFADQISKLKR